MVFRKITVVHFDVRRTDIRIICAPNALFTRCGRRHKPHIATYGIAILLPTGNLVDIVILEYALVLRLLLYWFACLMLLVLTVAMTVSIYGVQLLL